MITPYRENILTSNDNTQIRTPHPQFCLTNLVTLYCQVLRIFETRWCGLQESDNILRAICCDDKHLLLENTGPSMLSFHLTRRLLSK